MTRPDDALPRRLERRELVRQARAQGLPDLLAERVADVVDGSHLSDERRAEVFREMVSHFEDGLAAGRSPEDLSQSFGDGRHAATLIRAEKRVVVVAMRARSRPRSPRCATDQSVSPVMSRGGTRPRASSIVRARSTLLVGEATRARIGAAGVFITSGTARAVSSSESSSRKGACAAGSTPTSPVTMNVVSDSRPRPRRCATSRPSATSCATTARWWMANARSRSASVKSFDALDFRTR